MPDKPSDYRALPIELIHPDPNQPRKTFREEDLYARLWTEFSLFQLLPKTMAWPIIHSQKHN